MLIVWPESTVSTVTVTTNPSSSTMSTMSSVDFAPHDILITFSRFWKFTTRILLLSSEHQRHCSFLDDILLVSSHRRHSWHGWHVDNPKQLLQIWNSVRFRAQQRTQPTQKDTYESSSCCFNHDCGLTKSHFADPLHMFLSISRPWFIGASFWGESPSSMSRWECICYVP